MSSQLDELDATLRDLAAALSEADEATRPILAAQMASVKETRDMLARLEPEMNAIRQARPPLSPEVSAFYTPDPVAPVPQWVPDEATEASVSDEDMAPRDGARVYRQPGSISCALPGVPGVRGSVAHGLSLGFSPTGRLSSQRFFREGCLVWSVEYHATGGRARAGFYAARERLEYPEEGQHTWWSPGGRIVRQSYHRDGRPHGWTKSWEDDGYPISAVLYVDGEARDEIGADGRRVGGHLAQ